LLANIQSNTIKQLQGVKDILLKTNERKKEILLSAGVGNGYIQFSGEKDISGFNEAVHLPAEDHEMAHSIS
jgi:hypothetical protein